MRLLPYLLVGTFFGIVLTKAEMISWFRMQEMFRFQSFHMYGIMLGAIFVGVASVQWVRRTRARTMSGDEIVIPSKTLGHGVRYALGGVAFGIGWGLAGACPGPIFALLGNGVGVALVILLSALIGARLYASLRSILPH